MSRTLTACALLATPVLCALAGPLLASVVTPGDGAPYLTGGGHLLGTDGMGRDVLGLALRGGSSALGMACGAVAAAYLVGGALGLVAATTRRRWLDEALLRPAEVLLPIPSLLVISVVGVGWRGEPVAIALAVAAINAPAALRLVQQAHKPGHL